MKTPKPRRKGFTLVLTISLLVLLTMVAIGVLSLSSVTLRSSAQAVDQATARANARMAMMLALGELQQHAGLDTRVTARADLLDVKNPPILGVWKSWEGSDHEQTGSAQGRPISPGNYKTAKEGRFLSWLVSGVSEGSAVVPNTKKSTATAMLVGENSVGTGTGRDALQIHLNPTLVSLNSQRGAYAWWVSGENQKALVPQPEKPATDTAASWAAIAKSHSVVDTETFRLEALENDASLSDQITSLKQADLVATAGPMKASQEFFHDLSPWSSGLLTNTATGGWRKDLSLFTELYSTITASNAPMFRLNPKADIFCTLPAGSNTRADKSMLYPWSAYRGGGTEIPIYQFGAVSSWENLKDYATLYKRMTVSGNRLSIAPSSVAIDDSANSFGFIHKVRTLPVIARIQWVFSHSAVTAPPPAAGQPANPPGSLQPRLLLTPIITMWNPYNVEITSPAALRFTIPRPLPAALKYTVNNVTNTNHMSLMSGATNNLPALSAANTLNYNIAATFKLNPGETRVFSPQSTTPIDATALCELAQGYRSQGGHFFPVLNNSGQPIVAPGSASIKAQAKFDTTYNDGSVGVGIYLDMSINGRRHLVYRMVYPPALANEVYKPLNDLLSMELSACVSSPKPFMSTMFGARTASKTHIPAKGFVQSSPLVNYTAMGGKDVVESTIGRHYGGTNHPVNSPFDYSFVEHFAAGDDRLPNSSDTTGRGYIMTGFLKSDGLTRCVIAELPSRPLVSLAELQHWDLRYENPIPPYAINIIANSDATPLLPANAVVNSADASLSTNLQHDDSYCANHILFDDWFFSSIAPLPTTFGNSGKTLQVAYTESLTGVTPLPNRAYKALGEDQRRAAQSAAEATAVYNKNIRDRNAWRNVASRLEVEGMFNVNSTSVKAWRALLGHARKQKTAFISDSGTSWTVSLSGENDHPVSRFSIAGDTVSSSQGSSGGFFEAAEFAGYRVFEDKQLDALAEKIVEQVRLRGPFLSLSEFVNRQLSSGDLALAGTLQSALNELAKSPSLNPYAVIAGRSENATATPAGTASTEYKFAAAANGESAYGLPGWTRQADLLRPLAPILSARDDTFVIRAYGDARDSSGTIKARAVCEVVVKRNRQYIDPSEAAELVTPSVKPLNIRLGRRFAIHSFRWLHSNEI